MYRDPSSFREQLLELASQYETLYAACRGEPSNECLGPAGQTTGELAENSSLLITGACSSASRTYHIEESRSLNDEQPKTVVCGYSGIGGDPKPSRIAIFDLDTPCREVEHEDSLPSSESIKSSLNLKTESLDSDGNDDLKFVSSMSTTSRATKTRWPVLSPLGLRLFLWDSIIFMLAIFEFWRVPFQMVFLSPDSVPTWHSTTYLIITSFFACDIIINFNTAFVNKEDQLEIRQPQAAVNYIKSWFIVDVLSSVPFDLFLDLDSAQRMERVALLPYVLKGLRCLKFFRTLCHVGPLASRRIHLVAPIWSRYFVISSLTTILFCGCAHVNGVIFWALDSTWTPTIDSAEALDRYWMGFWWGFITFMQASPLPLPTAGLRVLEIAVKIQSHVFLALLGFWGFFHAMVAFHENAHFVQLRADAVMYLRQHRVSYALQRQVLQTLEETARTRALQRHFNEVVTEFLPQELRRTINKELWSPVIASFKLFTFVSTWSPDFIDDLCVLAYQETYASNSILFRLGDRATAAYYVLSGEVSQSKDDSHTEPPLITGMWVGERALLVVKMRRHTTAVTSRMSTFVTIESKPFHELLDRLGIKDRYGEFLNDQLWRGICARCGSFGDHFPEACNKNGNVRTSLLRSATKDLGSLVTHVLNRNESDSSRFSPDSPSGPFGADLRGFLQRHGLLRLEPHLVRLGIRSLAALERMDSRARIELRNSAVPCLSDTDLEALTPRHVSRYGKKCVRWSQTFIDDDEHFIFLSHYKVEAGTEASLMRTELELLLQGVSKITDFSVPVFLDSEDLTDLDTLKLHVLRSHNVLLLLTPGVISRPWVLVELATAASAGIPVLPVMVCKEGCTYEFPSADEISKCSTEEAIGESGVQLIRDAGFQSEDIIKAVRDVFLRIAVPYSPHRPASIRKAELETLLKQCHRIGGRRS